MVASYLANISLKRCIDEFFQDRGYLKKTPLCHSMTSFGSDKGTGFHNYTTLYHKLFKTAQNVALNIFELGLGTNYADVPSNMGKIGRPGASLFSWRQYFPASEIFGADIDARILFQTDRIKTFFCDQTNPASISLMFLAEDLLNVAFDVIIEDGLHEFDAHLTFLQNSIGKLKKGGIYIAEDLSQMTVKRMNTCLYQIKKEYMLDCIQLLTLPGAKAPDNSLLLIQK